MKVAKKILSTTHPITLHYDTTTRESVEGEWAALLIRFSEDNSLHRLRSISLAYEDHNNIVKFLVEQMKRLGVAANCSPVDIWKQITAYMTDAVSKNMHVLEAVAKILNSDHIPLHLLCCAHTCVDMDKKCLEVLIEIETAMDLKNKILKNMKSLAAFMRPNKSIVEIAIEAITKLVTNTGHKTSLAKQFSDICDAQNKQKKIGFYHQRRFTKLGHCAGTIVHNLEEIRLLLERHHGNTHSQACKLYVEVPFIINGMMALSKFTEFVTLPYLVLVQNENHEVLLNLLPQLAKDLQEGKLTTLEKYRTSFNFNFPPQTTSQQMILQEMAKNVSKGLILQRGREYSFSSSENVTTRATNISSLAKELLECLPTHNLDCERELAIFDKKVKRMSGFNSKSNYQGLRDEMVLWNSELKHFTYKDHTIFRKLDEMENSWNELQEVNRKEKRKEKDEMEKKAEIRWNDLLKICKSWGGPVISDDGVCSAELLIQNKYNIGDSELPTSLELKKMYKTEILFNKLSNFKPSLDYSVNKKSNVELRSTLLEIIQNEESKSVIDDEDTVIQYLEFMSQA